MTSYWERRYANGGTSGAGSYGANARAKAAYVNRFVATHAITSVVDWGCGDGNQLSQLRVPNYVGVEVSPTALARCMARNPRHAYVLWQPDCPVHVRADLGLSMDVLHHFPDDAVYTTYLRLLIGSARRWLLVHSTNHDATGAEHVRHRVFVHDIVRAGWTLSEAADDPMTSGFYAFTRDRIVW